MADFRVKTPAVDPTAFAEVLQRKAQMEQQQLNIETERKQGRFKRILEAVQGGQAIAANMVDLATKRNELEATRKQQKAQQELTDLVGEPSTLPPSSDPKLDAIMQANFKAEREKRLIQSLSQAAPKDFNKALLDEKLGSPEKQFAPQQASIEFADGSIKPATFKGGKYYYANTDVLIPPSDIAGRGFGLVPVTNSDGSVSYVSRSTAQKAGTVSTATEKTSIVDNKPLKTSINQLQTSEVGRLEKLKEDFNVDPAVKAAITKQGDYKIASGAVETQNWVGDAAMISVAAKGLGRDVGNLSAEEQERYKTSPELIRKVKNKWSRWTTGIIPPQDREDFREALRVAEAKNNEVLDKKIDTYGRVAANRIKSLDPEFAKSYLYEKSPSTELKPIEQMTLEELEAEEKRLTGKK